MDTSQIPSSMADKQEMEEDVDVDVDINDLESDGKGDPVFRLLDTSTLDLDKCPKGLPEHLEPKYRHLSRQYFLLEDLWEIQLGEKKHRHYWNIRAAHEFWKENAPKTYEGRTIGWTENWIEEALYRTSDEIDEMDILAQEARHASGEDQPVMHGSKLRWKKKRDGTPKREEGKEEEQDGMVGVVSEQTPN